ncbi:unnamed protein product [Rotaria socialis]|uniref:Uncharacterized protein n=1 Tax=Rotaria socialis TaxID=392032 RepID=A0A818A6H3_9BILA|nr:unnamed protein product [Rotaria socialis]CAF3383935.1 unnamed protein product [Rotaria socialis]CAF3403049.1 unnamed protein product [Rotaria socialis]CAF3533863.1 unnamed protein product [Rotaria socialis]CAF3741897.1 unnamed protein product [Rotaria socialis]
MFGIGTKTFDSSMPSVYLLIFIMIANKFIFVHCFVNTDNDEYQNQLEKLQQDAIKQLVLKYVTNPDRSFSLSEKSRSDDDYLQSPSTPTIRRRFCCMNPLGSRKRSVRNLLRKQQLSNAMIG